MPAFEKRRRVSPERVLAVRKYAVVFRKGMLACLTRFR